MLLVETYLAPSPIHGIGCFSGQFIVKGTELWKLNPLIDIVFDRKMVALLPRAAQCFLETYAYIDSRYGPVLCGDNTRFLNHSPNPALVEMNGKDVASRDLQKGDEITVDYRTFCDGMHDTFLSSLRG